MIISITKETHIMSKVTIQTQITFGVTSIMDKELLEGQVKQLKDFVESGQKFASSKLEVFTKMMLQAYEKEGIDGFAGQLVQYCFRESLQDFIKHEIVCKGDDQTNKATPVRVQLLETKHSNKCPKDSTCTDQGCPCHYADVEGK